MQLPDLPTYGEAFIHLATAALILLAFGSLLYFPLAALVNKVSSLVSKIRRARVAE